MENLKLNVLTKDQLSVYLKESCHVKYEAEIINEMMEDLNNNDFTKLERFQRFGDSFRTIISNVYAYRKQLEFGFTEISFDQYGWLTKPEFLDKEKLIFGNPGHYMQHSTICIARGINHVWTNSISYTYGCAGGGSPLSVFGEQFNSRESGLSAGLVKLKELMTAKLNNTDTTNYKQPIITETLRNIATAQINMVQLSLF